MKDRKKQTNKQRCKQIKKKKKEKTHWFNRNWIALTNKYARCLTCFGFFLFCCCFFYCGGFHIFFFYVYFALFFSCLFRFLFFICFLFIYFWWWLFCFVLSFLFVRFLWLVSGFFNFLCVCVCVFCFFLFLFLWGLLGGAITKRYLVSVSIKCNLNVLNCKLFSRPFRLDKTINNRMISIQKKLRKKCRNEKREETKEYRTFCRPLFSFAIKTILLSQAFISFYYFTPLRVFHISISW